MYSVDKIEQLRASDDELARTIDSMARHFA
jgi:hypothetical protein